MHPVDPRADSLIEGVLSDLDPLVASTEYWRAMVKSASGPIASARNRAYGTVVGGLENAKAKAAASSAATKGGDSNEHSGSGAAAATGGSSHDCPLTLEDIEQMTSLRQTSPGVDAVTLCSLLLGRGAAMRIPVRHEQVADVYMF